MLVIDNMAVAQATVNDAEAPSSLSLFYNTTFDDPIDHQVMVVVLSDDDAIINQNELQYGY